MTGTAEHETVVSFGTPVITGFCVSLIVRFAVAVVKLPQSSVAVNITVALPTVARVVVVKLVSLCVHVLTPQLSVARPAPWLFNQFCISAVLPEPLHSLIVSFGVIVITGLIVSCTVKICVAVYSTW